MTNPIAQPYTLPAGIPDFNVIRQALVREIQSRIGLDQQHVIYEEPEQPNFPRPSLPYFSVKILVPAAKKGDDDHTPVLDGDGNPTTVWNSGGVRQMTAEFNAYGRSHEEAYNLMSWWQSALDTETVQGDLRESGLAVWTIGNVADLSKLLNTGYEGRAHLECTFGIAMNLTEDLGQEETVTVVGEVTTDQGNAVGTTVTVSD
jgi:hypothetical protein